MYFEVEVLRELKHGIINPELYDCDATSSFYHDSDCISTKIRLGYFIAVGKCVDIGALSQRISSYRIAHIKIRGKCYASNQCYSFNVVETIFSTKYLF